MPMSGNTDSIYDQLKASFPEVSMLLQEPLSKHTYFKVGGPAEVYLEVKTTNELSEIVSFCRKNSIPFTLFGGGSNVLVQDKGLSGVVIKNMTSNIEIMGETVVVDSGVLVNVLVRKTIDQGLGGLEYFMGLPGTVGGAVVNNSHYKKQLFGEHITSIKVVDILGKIKEYKAADLQFSYDYSILQKTHETVLSVTLKLTKADKNELQKIALESTQYRSSTQPIGLPSSGCIFKNVEVPVEMREKFDGKETIGAGYLIDRAGLKGTKVGGAVVSDKHANFIVNTGNATSQDILNLCEMIEKTVKEKFGLVLHREVFVL